MLTSYLTITRNLLGNPSGSLYSSAVLVTQINTARQQIAAEFQCVRYLAANAPSVPALLAAVLTGGVITSVTVVGGGAGYVLTPSILVSGDGSGANLQAVISNGVVTSVVVISGGTEFTTAPALSTVGGGNEPNLVTVEGQEVYPFSLVTFGSVQGYSEVLALGNVSVIWGQQRFTLARRSWSTYQATIRNYTQSYQDVPGIAAQFGQGVNGSLYMYPVPNAPYSLEWDCMCLPAAIATDTDPEVIPYPWTDAVPYFAAYLAFMSSGRNGDADRMWKLFEMFGKRARAFSQPRLMANPYGR
jgi:hypothetical protein